MLRRLSLALLFVLALSAAPRAISYYAFEQVTVAGTAIGFTSATISVGSTHPQATQAACRVETAEIRYRFDGTAPTSTVGILLEVGDVIVLSDPVAMKQFSAIRTTSTSGVLSCSYVG